MLIFVNNVNHGEYIYDYLHELFDNKKEEEVDVSIGLYCKSNKSDRYETLINFMNNKIDVLICTDLAARGLDFKSISLVIQYDFALNIVQHFHRIGRAGRKYDDHTDMKYANIINLYTNENKDLVQVIQQSNNQQQSLQYAFSHRRGFRKKIRQNQRKKKAKIKENEHFNKYFLNFFFFFFLDFFLDFSFF